MTTVSFNCLVCRTYLQFSSEEMGQVYLQVPYEGAMEGLIHYPCSACAETVIAEAAPMFIFVLKMAQIPIRVGDAAQISEEDIAQFTADLDDPAIWEKLEE